jgi:large subunit ribosomal protein L47
MFAKSLSHVLKPLSVSSTSAAYGLRASYQQLRLLSANLAQKGGPPQQQQARQVHTSPLRLDLMEFFDDKKNWGERFVKVGRSWRVDELRIRSNTDLHKLWYVLLKERNMLMTMEHECKRQLELFPNPERLDKVEESLENIETVVRERNRAYHFLETGTSGERPGGEIENFLGLKEYVQHNEYHVPKYENKKYLLEKEAEPKVADEEKRWFMTRFMAKKRKEHRGEIQRQELFVLNTLREHPDCDLETLQENYPLANVARCVRRVKTRHGENLRGRTFKHMLNLPWRF